MRPRPRALARLLPVLLLAACSPRPGDPPEPRPDAGAALYAAGEELGYLEPCGCTRPQLGGLARKGTAVADGILVENGDLVPAAGRLNEIKAETFLMAFSEAGCRALNLGERDLTLGVDFLRSAADLATFPLLCGNLRDARGDPVFPAFTDLDLPSGAVRVIGVLEPALAPEERLEDPRSVVADALGSAPAGARAILLYHGRRAGAEALAKAFPALDAVVYAHTGGDPEIASPRVMSPGDKARFLVRLGSRPTVIELTEDIPDSEPMVRAMRTYVRRIEGEDLLHRMNPKAPIPPGRGGSYVGDRACAACHAEASRTHEASLHAKAIEPLERVSRTADPDCVTCHVVGYGYESGFLSVAETPALARVGCESCHGPGGDHVGSAGNSRTVERAAETCDRCHNADTDPHFEFEGKWAKIRHE